MVTIPLVRKIKTSCWLQNKSSVLAWPCLTWPGQSGTFDLKSTGGFEQVEWAPCTVYTVTFLSFQSNETAYRAPEGKNAPIVKARIDVTSRQPVVLYFILWKHLCNTVLTRELTQCERGRGAAPTSGNTRSPSQRRTSGWLPWRQRRRHSGF